MTAPYIPFDPTDPYGLRKRLDPSLLNALRQPADITAAGRPPLSPVPTIGPAKGMDALDEAPESDFKRMMKSLGRDVDQAITDTPWFGALWPMIKGTAGDVADVGKIALEPTGIVDQPPPGSPSRGERLTDKVLPLAAGLYPMGNGARAAEEAIAAIDAAAPKGVVSAINEGERSIGTDAAGYTITNRGRAVRPSAPPLPEPVTSEAEIAVGPPDAEGLQQTSRGRTVRVPKPLPRPNSVAEKITQAAVRDPINGEVYPGVIHEDGRAAWAEAGGDPMIPPERGYVTNRGRFIPEEQARAATGKPDFSSKDIGPNGHPLSLDNTLAAEMPHAPTGVLPGPDNNQTRVIADRLIKEDAISRAKAAKEAGQNVELQRQPDGTWSLLKKGEPSTAVVKAQPKAIEKIGPKGEPVGESDFQSRLYTALDYNHSDTGALTPEEWYKRLSGDKSVPKSELDAIFDRVKTPDHEAQLDAVNEKISEREKKFDELKAKYNAGDGDNWDANWADRSILSDELKPLYAEQKELRGRLDLSDYMDKNDKISPEEMKRLVADESPAANMKMTVHSAEEGAGTTSEADLEHEVEFHAEQEREWMRDQLHSKVEERDYHIGQLKRALEPVLGNEGTRQWVDENLMDEMHSGDDLLRDETDRDAIAEGFTPEMHGALNNLRTPSAQLPLGEMTMSTKDREYVKEIDDQLAMLAREIPNSRGQEYNQLLRRQQVLQEHKDLIINLPTSHAGSNIRPEFSDAQWDAVKKAWSNLEKADKKAATYSKRIADDDLDWDSIHQQAQESLNENEPRGDVGDTEYSSFQRVDPNAAYREILIHQEGAGIRGGHMKASQDMVAHARMEIHGDVHHGNKTALMIEAQSDFGQKNAAGSKNPFADTDRWVQLSTGGSLTQAAKEGCHYFSWVTPENRMDAANLPEAAAEITYGKGVPKAVERIFKWLDIPVEHANPLGGEFPRIHLTPEARKKILKAGIPALGLVGASAISVKAQAGRKSRDTAGDRMGQ